ncbi:MAG: FtsH protease activity modulator HflK, partial [Chthoniobacterales bacterium]|nr:FtsH protease activity modulator HflK [Chthoniobacterales bacterium]
NKFLHVAKDPRKTLRDCSEAVMRRIVGNSLGSDVLTEKRVEVANTARKELQQLMDSFDIGLSILTIELQDVTPPDKVKPAFNEVNQAEQERERLINEAEKRRNQVIPRAEGEARQIIAEAEAYAAKRIAQARGETERFNAILAEFQLAPDVMRNRLLLESIEQSLPQNGKLVVLDPSSPSPLPFLNLDKNIQKTATQQNQSPLNQN